MNRDEKFNLFLSVVILIFAGLVLLLSVVTWNQVRSTQKQVAESQNWQYEIDLINEIYSVQVPRYDKYFPARQPIYQNRTTQEVIQENQLLTDTSKLVLWTHVENVVTTQGLEPVRLLTIALEVQVDDINTADYIVASIIIDPVTHELLVGEHRQDLLEYLEEYRAEVSYKTLFLTGIPFTQNTEPQPFSSITDSVILTGSDATSGYAAITAAYSCLYNESGVPKSTPDWKCYDENILILQSILDTTE